MALPPALSQALTQLVEPVVSSAGYDLEDIEITPAGKRRVVRISVDKDGGIGLDDVAEVTREISRVLDDSDALGNSPYTLEVGSPGLSRPLTLPRHWRRNADRLVKVTLADGETLTGRITEAADDAVTLDVAGTERRLPYDEVRKALVQVEFNRKDES